MEEEITFSSNEEGVVLICMEIAKRLLRETGETESFRFIKPRLSFLTFSGHDVSLYIL